MGLLDAFNSPEMGLAMGLLNAGGASSHPVSLGQGIAQGYQGFQQAQENNQQRAAREQQMQMQKMQLAQILQTQQGRAAFRAKLPPEMQSMFDVAPDEVVKSLFKDNTPMTVSPGSVVFDRKTNQPIFSAPFAPKERSLPEGMQLGSDGQTLQEIPGYVAMKSKIAAAGRQPQTATPFFQSVSDATKGMGTFDARTGKYTFPDSALVKPQNDPKLQGQISGAKVAGEASAKRDVNMSGIGDVIARADSILKGKAGNKPTSSGIGVGVDAAAGFIGVSPKGAAEASELKALGGALVAKMPRMEGPQSNMDVQLYREMAGDIANPMLPLERRIKALETVKSLYSKYDKSAGNGVDALLEKYK